MKKYIISVLFILAFITGKSQDKPVYNYFLLNPYVYNPAYAGYEYRPVLYLSYRQQWAGIDGAPTTTTAVFHTPVSETLSFGTSLYNDRRSFLSSSNLMLSLAYKLRFDLDHYINFGIAAGVGFNTISDLDQILNDPRYANDMAVLNAIENSFYLDGQFGMNYHIKGFNFGLAFPRLFQSALIQSEEFTQGTLDPLNSYQVIVSYRPDVEDKITFEPTVAYRMQSDNQFNYFEAGGLLNIKNAIWVGGSYRQHYGVSTLVNLNFGDKMHLAYSYDIASGPSTGFMGGTHDITLRLNLGEKKKPKKRERVIEDESSEDPYELYLKNKEEEKQNVDEQADDQQFKPVQNQRIEDKKEVIKGNHLLELDKGYYVIVSTFSSYEKAESYSDWLFTQGYYTRYGYSSDTQTYYVYIYYSLLNPEKTEFEKDKINKKSMFNNAWILTVK